MNTNTYIALEQLGTEDAVTRVAAVVVDGVGTATDPVILKGKAADVADVIAKVIATGHERWQNWLVMEKAAAVFAKEYTDSVTYGDVADYIEGFVKMDMLVLTEFNELLEAADEAVNRMLVRVLRGFMSKQRQIIIGLTAPIEADSAEANKELLELLGLC
ncbi:hypothetical protein [Veillonella magna]|uniref:hypothetical protein n=1 Tax=Veillonella magna TaxID=464322 RepID=UPI0023F102C4|nr:hypothetical protein [Veillonella magna]MBD8976681.1 hypothetical protein [Veillonella magna]